MAEDDSLGLSNPLMSLRGIARALFRELGGGEEFIRNERLSFTDHSEEPNRSTQA
jgi:hypothetical protein